MLVVAAEGGLYEGVGEKVRVGLVGEVGVGESAREAESDVEDDEGAYEGLEYEEVELEDGVGVVVG